MLEIYLNNKYLSSFDNNVSAELWFNRIHNELNNKSYYLLHDGKIVSYTLPTSGVIHIVPTCLGGKGGFGSMLRAIGAQIEKTTNREACRDLSGRRLRDINEEKRLKNWIDQQAEREQDAADRKQKKLERLCEKPRHEFKDATYDKERSELSDRLEDAITQGLSATVSGKRKLEPVGKVKSKKSKIWDDELLTDSDDSDSEDDQKNENLTASKENHMNKNDSSKLENVEDSTENNSESEKSVEVCKESKIVVN